MLNTRRRDCHIGKLNVDGTEIQVLQIEEDDCISLTDMVRKIDNGPALIEKWLRNKNTIEFLGIWEEMYRIHTDAIKVNLIPPELTPQQTSIIYVSEADVLNMALFGMTAKQWRNQNPDKITVSSIIFSISSRFSSECSSSLEKR